MFPLSEPDVNISNGNQIKLKWMDLFRNIFVSYQVVHGLIFFLLSVRITKRRKPVEVSHRKMLGKFNFVAFIFVRKLLLICTCTYLLFVISIVCVSYLECLCIYS